MNYHDITVALAARGLQVRGGFHPLPPDGVPDVRTGVPAASVVLIGSGGSASWQAFRSAQPAGANPLDRWTRAQVAPLAAQLDARDVYPDERPFLPFQRWARRAEDVHVSPLGLLIHPDYGLWHAYRAALLIPARWDLPAPGQRPSPCDACAQKPCLAACPVDSFAAGRFDSGACHAHLGTPEGDGCRDLGCKSRNACPVGRAHRYGADQMRFHMRAFHET